MPRFCSALGIGILLVLSSRASAVVEAEMPLAQLVKDSHAIAVATMGQIDREKGKGVLTIQRVVQGDPPASAIPIRLMTTEAGEGSPSDMLERVEDGTEFVLFLSSLSPTEHQAFAYSNGSWFKLRGVDQLDKLKLLFVQGEPYLRRTWHGEIVELVALLDAFVAGKGKLPEIDKSAKPGLGPALYEAPPIPVVAAAPDQIEMGPAWRTEGDERDESSAAPGRYVAVSILLAALLGLVFMMTRSSPGATS
jgi:hypothetical protein